MTSTQDYSIRQICEWFWDVERRLDLLALREGDVYLWRILRFRLYQALAHKTGLFDSGPPAPSRHGLRARILFALRILHDALFRHTALQGRVEHVVVPYNRSSSRGDMHLQALLAILPPGRKGLVLYTNSTRPHPPRGSKSMSGAILLNMLRSGFRRSFLSSESRRLMDMVAAEIADRFAVEIPVAEMAQEHMRRFERSFPAYVRLFRRIKAKTLYVIVGYTYYEPVAAAHACGMTVVELQHGAFTPYHLGYSFPGGADVPYSPDRLLCFGRFWPEITPLPRRTRCEVVGAPHLSALSPGPKVRGSVLFLSQPIVGCRLLRFAVACAVRLPDRQVTYHLHPSEAVDEVRGWLDVAGAPGNFTLSLPSCDVYELLARSEIAAGVSSTALQEGMVLGCRTILVDMPSIEYMDEVIARGDAILTATPEAFCAALERAPLCREPDYYYAAPQNFI